MGLKVGGSPSKYFNEKNKQAAPLKGDSPYKNAQFPFHINFSHARWNHIEDVPTANQHPDNADPDNIYPQTAAESSGFVPTAEHQAYLDQQYEENPNQRNPWATQNQPWYVPPEPEETPEGEETPPDDGPCYNAIGQLVDCDNPSNAAGTYFNTEQYDEDGDGNMDGFSEIDPVIAPEGGDLTDPDNVLHWEPDCSGLQGDELQQCLAWHAAYGGVDGGPSSGGYGGGGIGPSSFGGITPSNDPNKTEGVLGRQARERQEQGLDPHSRGGQVRTGESNAEYPWGDNDGGGNDGPPNYIDPGEAEVIDDPIRDPIINNNGSSDIAETIDPIRDTMNITNEGGPGGPNPNLDVETYDTTDSFGSSVSPANTRPDGRPNVSIPNTGRPDVSITPPIEVDTDIFGNVVSPVDEFGNKRKFTTVKTPKQFTFGRNQSNNNNNRRRFIQPRNFG